ncbi:hypothetical protein HF313_09820 [Massilia atriviolacea]|uniref:Phage tail tape measure protein n=1 Tax=Massilia atriviolacea TaxID=2495579 RepID=A0A430HF71_9BURK|nr:hypothetical protein [Massilia atriviolacea]RSZ56159.1 hypothetical protein EJB06_26335 [Massilia atriviolacea]
MITIGGTVSAGLKSALGSTASMVTGIGKALDDLNRRHANLKLFIDTFESMGKSAKHLRSIYENNTKAIGDMVAAQDKLELSQKRKAGIKAHAANIGAAGAGASTMGKSILGSLIPGVKEATEYDSEQSRVRAVGLSGESGDSAFKFAKEMKQFGLSQVEKLELMRDALVIAGDQSKAEMIMPMLGKIKFGNVAMFGTEKGEENTAAFMDMVKVIRLRGGLDSPEAFKEPANIIQRLITASGGRVVAADWRDLLTNAGVMGEGMDSKVLFHSMAPLVQTMGGKETGAGLGALYNSMYQGTILSRQFKNMDKLGLIGDRSKLDMAGKSGRTVGLNPGALLGSDLFKSDPFQWMNTVLVPQLNKKGITDENKILDAIGMISADPVSRNFLTRMYTERKSIAASRENSEKAQGVDQVVEEGRTGVSGKLMEAKAKLADAKLGLGIQMLPLYTKALTLASNALEKFNAFSERNPALTSTLVVGVAALGVGLAAIGPLLVTAAGAMGIYGAAQTMLTRVAVGGGATEGAGMLGRALASLRTIVPGVLAVLRPLALAFMLVAPPMGLLVAGAVAIAAVGVLIWKYWEPLKAFFSSFGSALMSGLAPVGKGILAAFAPIWDVLKPIVMPVLEGIGTFVSRLAAWFGELLTPVSATAQLTTDFGNAGKVCGEVVATAFNLMLLPIDLVRASVKWISENIGGVIDKTMQLGSGGLLGAGWTAAASLFGGSAPAMAGSAPALPPVRGAGPAAGAASSQANTFNITQQPWQDPRALAEEIIRLQLRQQGINERSGLRDYTQ